MACLPETECEKIQERETAEDDRAHDGFQTGFLAGCLTALFCVLVFLTGWIASERGYLTFGSGQKENQNGADVLTSEETIYKLKEIQALLNQNYLNDIDETELADYLFMGLTAGLDDRYASYYSASELQSVMDSNRGEYYGIGITVSSDSDSGELRVQEVYSDSPASEAGVEEGDLLRKVNEVLLKGMSLKDTVSLIKSQKQTFTLTVFRKSEDREIDLKINCREVELNYVEYEKKENQTGYIRITEFTESAAEQFYDAVLDLKKQGIEKLIIDLRNNPGGLLTSVCDILDKILPEGLIVYTENRNGDRKEYTSSKKQSISCEIAVLVNGSSASASEIFAGAIQDRGAGFVVGSKTFGKGVVQKTYTLSDGSAIKFTTEKYYTPGGQNIDGNGILPDYPVETVEEDGSDSVLEKAMEVLNR